MVRVVPLDRYQWHHFGWGKKLRFVDCSSDFFCFCKNKLGRRALEGQDLRQNSVGSNKIKVSPIQEKYDSRHHLGSIFKLFWRLLGTKVSLFLVF